MEFESIKRIFKPECPMQENEIIIKKDPLNKKVKQKLKVVKKEVKEEPNVVVISPVQSSPLSKISNKYELFQYVKKIWIFY